jgi:DNA-binding response OmpR family regulator
MPVARILLIESPRTNAPSFGPLLQKKGFRVATAHRIDRALLAAEQQPPDLVILDASSMRTSGSRLCRQIHARLDGVPVILLAPPDFAPDPTNGATITLQQPVTPRKLLNRIARLLPGDGKFSLQAGPIQLNVAQRKVRCKGKESRLTPKQTKLLEVFLHNPGQLLTRESLIRQVWHTDYTGDTRTLDVHMSWLRQAIEPDPSRPVFLRTVRGVGYRFDPRDSTASD